MCDVVWVHESCTRMNTDHVHLGGKCSFWKDAIGNMYGGSRYLYPSSSMSGYSQFIQSALPVFRDRFSACLNGEGTTLR
jgi:hypothetical protein